MDKIFLADLFGRHTRTSDNKEDIDEKRASQRKGNSIKVRFHSWGGKRSANSPTNETESTLNELLDDVESKRDEPMAHGVARTARLGSDDFGNKQKFFPWGG